MNDVEAQHEDGRDFARRLDAAMGAQPHDRPAIYFAERGARRLRRRRTAYGAVAVGVLAVMALPAAAAIRANHDTRHSSNPVTVAPSSTSPWVAPADWQQVDYEDLTFFVPGTWQPGAPSQWCLQPNRPPRIELPGDGGSTLVGCIPENGYGVTLNPTAPTTTSGVRQARNTHAYPAEAWIGTAHFDGGMTMQVVADSREIAEHILSSAYLRR